jgi:hypothetical protein
MAIYRRLRQTRGAGAACTGAASGGGDEEMRREERQRCAMRRALLDVETLKILNVTKQWIRDHTTRIEPIVPHIRLGRKIRFRLADIKRFIDQQAEIRPKWERAS